VASSPASKPTLTKKFFAAEITDRQAKGLCFKCHDKFVSVHRDVCKRLFCIEVASNDGDDSDPTISIHALIGIQPHATSTMQLLVTIGGATLCALLDSGSMHNFIDTVVAQHAGITFHRTTGLHAAVANGDRLSCSGRCSDLAISIADEDFHIMCYRLSLGSFDMVLGIQWLESLGPVLWDF
jgi:hypothetical protein